MHCSFSSKGTLSPVGLLAAWLVTWSTSLPGDLLTGPSVGGDPGGPEDSSDRVGFGWPRQDDTTWSFSLSCVSIEERNHRSPPYLFSYSYIA